MSKLKETNGVVKNRLPELEAKEAAPAKTTVKITPPNTQIAVFKVIGTSPYVQNKFSEKAKQQMINTQMAGSTAKKGAKRPPKDFNQCFQDSQYKPTGETWRMGAIPATAFRAAMVAACRLVSFKMTDAKQCIYILEDGYDKDEMIPLIRMTKGVPTRFDQAVRNDNGSADIRARPVWQPGWEAIVRIKFDADIFTLDDVANLLARAGEQVGIGEGRMASRMCVGLGWGAFRIATADV